MDVLLGLLAIALLILANGLFVVGEFALVTVDRTRVEQLAEEGDRSAALVLDSLRRLSFELSSAQLGITITSIVLGYVGEPVLARVLEPLLDALPLGDVDAGSGLSVVVALGLATVTQMVMGELVPKSWAIARPLTTAKLVVRPFRWFAAVFGPLIRVLNGAANLVLRLFRVEPQEELTAVRSLDELDLLIRSSAAEGTLDAAAF
ncbi:MAG TPA: CNNM domain-containing protein, partial [Acidimicrobiia bacterium]|nr:CNNM domain-containing protein [Acidimicrobiia bacterium]